MKRKPIAVALSAGMLCMMLSGTAAAQAKDQTGAATGTGGTTQSQVQAPDMSGSYQASSLMDMQVKNAQNQELGTISDVIIDKDGKASHVILQEGGVLGMGQNRYVVPWDRVQLSPDQQTATIDVNKDQLSSEFAAFEEGAGKQKQKSESERSPSTSGGTTGSEGGSSY